MKYETWVQENSRRLADSIEFCKRHGITRQLPEPTLTRDDYRKDQRRHGDGRVHPWWVLTDAKYRR